MNDHPRVTSSRTLLPFDGLTSGHLVLTSVFKMYTKIYFYSKENTFIRIEQYLSNVLEEFKKLIDSSEKKL